MIQKSGYNIIRKKEAVTIYYQIKEASEKLNIPASTIRYYEKKGLLPHLKRTESGIRLFDDEMIDWITLVIYLLKTGMEISVLRKYTELAMEGDSTFNERLNILLNHKLALEEKQKELDNARNALNKKLSAYVHEDNQNYDEETKNCSQLALNPFKNIDKER